MNMIEPIITTRTIAIYITAERSCMVGYIPLNEIKALAFAFPSPFYSLFYRIMVRGYLSPVKRAGEETLPNLRSCALRCSVGSGFFFL
jgi:hypothetical protein